MNTITQPKPETFEFNLSNLPTKPADITWIYDVAQFVARFYEKKLTEAMRGPKKKPGEAGSLQLIRDVYQSFLSTGVVPKISNPEVAMSIFIHMQDILGKMRLIVTTAPDKDKGRLLFGDIFNAWLVRLLEVAATRMPEAKRFLEAAQKNSEKAPETAKTETNIAEPVTVPPAEGKANG